MRRSSWIVLGICIILILCLGSAYLMSQRGAQTLGRAEAETMLKQMRMAVRHKDAGAIMEYIATGDDVKIDSMRPEQIRLLLVKAFRSMDDPNAEVTNIAYTGTDREATLIFDLKLHNDGPDLNSIPYDGRITLNLQRTTVSHWFGISKTLEWRIVNASTTGQDPSLFGDYQ